MPMQYYERHYEIMMSDTERQINSQIICDTENLYNKNEVQHIIIHRTGGTGRHIMLLHKTQ